MPPSRPGNSSRRVARHFSGGRLYIPFRVQSVPLRHLSRRINTLRAVIRIRPAALLPEDRPCPEIRRGVYETPRELASFVVRSVHGFIRTRLSRPDGLADAGVRFLDPAAGPMNFVIEAWRVAFLHRRRTRSGEDAEAFVRNHLLPHFHGIEILPSACAEGERRALAFLAGEGYGPKDGERPAISCADALAAPSALSEEGGMEMGRTRLAGSGPFPVIVGNPPWSGYAPQQGEQIGSLLGGYVRPDGSFEEGYRSIDGRPLGERNTKWLLDDYVKFLRLAQRKIDLAGQGITALVVNHTCLDAPTFRGLRRSLARTFNEICALDLHGNRRKGERAPGGALDGNVFSGVAQGAAVLFLVKDGGAMRKVFRADLYGSAREKLSLLGGSEAEDIRWTEVRGGWLSDRLRSGGHVRSAPLPEIFPVHSLGVITGNDSRAVSIRAEDLVRDGAPGEIKEFLVRPFDLRFIRYSRELARPREAVMRHLSEDGNVALLSLRQSGPLGPAALVARCISGHKVLSGYHPNTVFPLYLLKGGRQVPNISPVFSEKIGGLLGRIPPAEDVLGYVYAILYHPAYRSGYGAGEACFPRIPYPVSREVFDTLSQLGRKLAEVHLLEGIGSSLRFHGDLATPLSKASAYSHGRLRLGDHVWAEGIAPEAWSSTLGDYRVLERWLRARKGRTLSPSELDRFGKVAEALRLAAGLERELAEISLGSHRVSIAA